MQVKSREHAVTFDRWDWVLAGGVFVAGLALYIRTLAPSVLLGDSAEFQTLAYTLGMAHNTGYAVYLLLGKVLTLLPIGEVAWRVNLLSASAAAVTLAEVYLVARLVSGRRAYGVVAALALGVNYLFWWQAIIAEVYTPAAAFAMGVLLLVILWDRTRRGGLLIAAGVVGGLAFGVHALVGLIAPAIVIYLLAAKANRRDWLRAAGGAITGLLGAAAAYLLIDSRNSQASIIHTFRAHANAFGLERADFDSALTRISFIITARQWSDQILNSSPARMVEGATQYLGATLETFSLLVAGLMLVGVLYLLIRRPRREGVLLLLAWLGMFLYLTNYHVGDIQVFYVPNYAILSVFLAAGLAGIEDVIRSAVERLTPRPDGGRWILVLAQGGLVLMVLLSLGSQRENLITSVQRGRITFLKQQDAGWPYPVNDPYAPRLRARRLASMIEAPDALVLLPWDRLYPFCYVAHVEEGKTGTTCVEIMPYGTHGVTRSLREALQEALDVRPVYLGNELGELRGEFSFRRVPGPEELYRLERR